MNKKDRLNIMREVQIRMNLADVNFEEPGEFEKIQDEFIDLVCKEKGWSLKDFYATDGKELNDLFNM